MRFLLSVLFLGPGVLLQYSTEVNADELRPVPLSAKITHVQPMTGIVLWVSNEAVRTAPIQLEFSYVDYSKIVREKGVYDWSTLETLLNEVASRRHQAVIRWHDTYVAKPTTIPDYIKALPDYHEVTALSEKKQTGFPDWSHPELQKFLPEFFSAFAKKYDKDPRIAFVQVGFGLWAEYHIYDGPMVLGKTFPSKDYQREFARHLSRELKQTPWMISVDAGEVANTPYAEDKDLLSLPFGLFDDSFNHADHAKYNEPHWKTLGLDRWQRSPMGGEFSFFEAKDQKLALAPNGPHGIPFEEHARKFHITFILGDAQPRHQKPQRIREAGLACGYRYRVTEFLASETEARVTVENQGIAPIYYDAFPTVNGVRATESLRGLLPQQSRTFSVAAGGTKPVLTIECDRLVPGQRIEFDAELSEAGSQ